MSTESWVREKLLETLNFTDKYTAQFLTSLAQKSTSPDDLVDKVRTTDTIDVNDSKVTSFLRELWNRIPRAAPKSNLDRIAAKQRELETVALLEKNKRYRLVESDEEEHQVTQSLPPKKVKLPDPDSDEDESKQLEKDRKERDEFSERLKKKDKAKQRNVATTGKGVLLHLLKLFFRLIFHIINLQCRVC